MDKPFTINNTGCCQRFNPTPWNEQKITWEDKLFVKDHIKSFFHIPINISKVIKENHAKIAQADAQFPESLMLTDENSLWGADMYFAISKKVPATKTVTISGTFLTKVFEGPYNNLKSWISEMRDFVSSSGYQMKKLYFSYTTCPKCAKKYGKNYVILFAQI